MLRNDDESAGGWLWRALVGATLSQVVLGVSRPALSYGALSIGVDGFGIGALAAAFAIAPMFLAIPLGSLAGRLRRVALVPATSAVVLIAGAMIAACGSDLLSLATAAVLLGIGNLGVLIGAQAWVSRSAPAARYSDGFGWMTAGMAFGQAVGPLLTGTVVQDEPDGFAGVSAAFWLAAAIAAVLLAVFVTPAVRRYEEAESGVAISAGSILRTPNVLRYMVVSAAVLTSVDLITAYLPVIGDEVGIPPSTVGVMLAVRGLFSTASRVLLGPLSRRFDASTLVVSSVIGTAFCLVLISLAPTSGVMIPALAVGGFLLGVGQPLTMTAVAVALPAPARSRGLAIRLLGNRIAQTVAPLAAGAVVSGMGAASVFVLQIVVLTGSAVWEIAARASGSDGPTQIG